MQSEELEQLSQDSSSQNARFHEISIKLRQNNILSWTRWIFGSILQFILEM